MGSIDSRPRVRKVAPCKSPQEEGGPLKPQWTLPGLPVDLEQPSGSLGRKKTSLPPLKQEITLSSLSEPSFAEGLPQKQSSNSSIIHSHPPRRPQALQPLALDIGHTSTASQMSMDMVCRDGGVHQFFTTGQTGHSGTSRMIQGGFLEAQTALTQQAHRHRQAHLRRAREQRRRKIVYTANVGAPNTEGIQRLKLVRRPTERNIFLDETTGESLDPSCILDAKALPPLHQHNAPVLCKAGDASQKDEAQGPKNRLEERTVHQTGHRGVFLDNNLSWTAERKIKRIDNRGKTQTDSWM